MLTIRLARGGRVHRPVYTIVATNSRSPRDGKFIERLGKYDPHTVDSLSGVQVDKIKSYLEKGAQISDTVRTLLKKHHGQEFASLH